LLCISEMDLSDYARKTGVKPAEFQEKLAAHGLAVSREIVRRWLSGAQAPGVKSLAAIEAATDNKVRRQHMRPDIFGRAA
jgi:DNA-binding transcriptional regulator YdaS (Cro superfamily)